MNIGRAKTRQAGFALFEGLAIVIVVVIIAAIGLYAAKHRDNPDQTATNSSSTNASQITAQPGTTTYVDQVTQSAAATEQSTDKSYDSQYQQAAASDSTAMSNLGGAYNESSL